MAHSVEHADVIPQDHGPWLYFVAPITFALSLIVIAWLSSTSF